MLSIELLLYAALLFLFFTVVFLPAGLLLLSSIDSQFPPLLRLCAAVGVSALFYSAAVLLLFSCGVPNFTAALVLYLLIIGALCCCLFRRERTLPTLPTLRGMVFAPLLCFVYFLFCLHAASFPEGSLHDVSGESVRLLSGLPLDNIIPYNLSRYLVEGIDPQNLEIIPTWKAADRGPLVGILAAVVFLVLGLEEKAHWLASSPGLFFVYQALLVYLNVLCMFAVYSLGAVFFCRRSAAAAVLLLGSMSFFQINVLFGWPKFFMAFYVLAALAVWFLGERSWKSGMLAGVLSAGAVLAHESAVFYLVSFLAIVSTMAILQLLRTKREEAESRVFSPAVLLRGLTAAGGLGAVLLPWIVYKSASGLSSPRLLYLHLFCLKDLEISAISFSEAASSYFSSNSWSEIIKARVINLFYPFDLSELWNMSWRYAGAPYKAAAAAAHLSFYQFSYALGLPLLLLCAFSCAVLWRRRIALPLLLIVIICCGALIPAAVLFGCPRSTWNHHWAYAALAVSVLPAGYAVQKCGFWAFCLFALSMGANVLILLFTAWFSETGSVYLHSSGSYLMVQGGLFSLFLLLGFWGMKGREDGSPATSLLEDQ